MFDREHRFHERAHEAYVAFMSSQPIAGIASGRIQEEDYFLMMRQRECVIAAMASRHRQINL